MAGHAHLQLGHHCSGARSERAGLPQGTLRRGRWILLCVLLVGQWCASAVVLADLLGLLSSAKPIAETSLGTVVGKSDANSQYYLGIPYAKPPLGDRRWRAPEPVEPWGRLEAFEFAPNCLQAADLAPGTGTVSEDCLYLNIWTPTSAKRGSHYPVMVWIYGGGFQQGYSSNPIYHGNLLAKRDVVVVSINYRLGAFGFMVSVHDGLWGNYGLQDQRLALQWVHDHIADFGGDPDCVTLFGESAGAMSAGLHMHMDGAGHLFHGVIMQSNPMGYKFRSITIANFMGQAIKRGLDCTDLQCMRNEPAAEILHQQDMLIGVPRSVGDFFSWGPVMTDSIHRNLLRRYSRTAEGAVPMMNVTQPLTMWGSGTGGAHVELPVLMGANLHEGQFFVYTAFPVNMPKFVYWGFVMALFKDSGPKVLREYGPMAEQYRGTGDYRPVMSQIINDYLFRCPTMRTAHLLQERRERAYGHAGAAPPVFVYEFSHPTQVPEFPACTGLSCHTAELPFVFEQLEEVRKEWSYLTYLARNATDASGGNGAAAAAPPAKASRTSKLDADVKVSKLMATFWTDFAKFGSPNHSHSQPHWPEWRGRRRWPTADRTSVSCAADGTCTPTLSMPVPGADPSQPGIMDINENPKVHTATRDCTCQFWDELQWRY